MLQRSARNGAPAARRAATRLARRLAAAAAGEPVTAGTPPLGGWAVSPPPPGGWATPSPPGGAGSSSSGGGGDGGGRGGAGVGGAASGGGMGALGPPASGRKRSPFPRRRLHGSVTAVAIAAVAVAVAAVGCWLVWTAVAVAARAATGAWRGVGAAAAGGVGIGHVSGGGGGSGGGDVGGVGGGFGSGGGGVGGRGAGVWSATAAAAGSTAGVLEVVSTSGGSTTCRIHGVCHTLGGGVTVPAWLAAHAAVVEACGLPAIAPTGTEAGVTAMAAGAPAGAAPPLVTYADVPAGVVPLPLDWVGVGVPPSAFGRWAAAARSTGALFSFYLAASFVTAAGTAGGHGGGGLGGSNAADSASASAATEYSCFVSGGALCGGGGGVAAGVGGVGGGGVADSAAADLAAALVGRVVSGGGGGGGGDGVAGGGGIADAPAGTSLQPAVVYEGQPGDEAEDAFAATARVSLAGLSAVEPVVVAAAVAHAFGGGVCFRSALVTAGWEGGVRGGRSRGGVAATPAATPDGGRGDVPTVEPGSPREGGQGGWVWRLLGWAGRRGGSPSTTSAGSEAAASDGGSGDGGNDVDNSGSGGGDGGGGGGGVGAPPAEPPSQGTPAAASTPAAPPPSKHPPASAPPSRGASRASPPDGRGGMATVAMRGAPPDVAAAARSRWADWARRAPPPLASPPPDDTTAWPPTTGAIEVHTHTPADGGGDTVHVCRLHRACVRRVDGAVILPAWAAAHTGALSAACGLRAIDAAANATAGASARRGGEGTVLFSDAAHRRCVTVTAWGDGRGDGGGMDLFGPPTGLPATASALLPALLPLAVGLDAVLGPPTARGNGSRSRRCLFPSSPAVAVGGAPAAAAAAAAAATANGQERVPRTGRWLVSVLSRRAAVAATAAAAPAAADPIGTGSRCPDRTHPSRVNVAVVLPPRLRGVHAHHWARATVRLLPRRPAGPHTLFWTDAAGADAADAAVAFRSVVTTSATAAVPPPALLSAPNVVWEGVGLDRRAPADAARSRRGQPCHLNILLLDRRASAGGTTPPGGTATADASSVVNLGALRRALDEAIPSPLFAPYRLSRVVLRTAHPDATAFEELVDGVQVADALLLADGAGAANLGWARPGTPVVSLAPFGHYAGTWFAAARSLGLRPRRVVCPPDPPSVTACFGADRSMDAAAAAVAASEWRAAAAAAVTAAADRGSPPSWGGGGPGAGAGGGPPVRVEGDIANSVTRRRTLPAERACVRAQGLLVDAAALARALLAEAVGSCYDPRKFDTPIG
ncbi:hypothetical protein MMPV_005590 [Pyropia vietnamensis]